MTHPNIRGAIRDLLIEADLLDLSAKDLAQYLVSAAWVRLSDEHPHDDAAAHFMAWALKLASDTPARLN